MRTVAIVGEYSPLVMHELQARLSPKYKCIHILNDQNFDKLCEADYVILRGPKINSDVLNSIKGKLQLIQRWGTGYDGVDVKRAGELGIAVAITGGVNSNAVSELAIALIFALYRHLIPLHNSLVKGIWDKKTYSEKTYEINGKTVGLVGCGSIGRLVAQKVQALGSRVVYYDVKRLPLEIEKEFKIDYAELYDLLQQSDIISLHLPATPLTMGMVDTKFISQMKPNAILINTARGSLINEKDLYEALKNHRILGAGIDTFAFEPPDANNPLLKLDNIVVTPHVGGSTVDLNDIMIDHVIGNIIRMENNEPLPKGDLVNGEYLISKKY